MEFEEDYDVHHGVVHALPSNCRTIRVVALHSLIQLLLSEMGSTAIGHAWGTIPFVCAKFKGFSKKTAAVALCDPGKHGESLLTISI